ncbi:hypothetical protein [Sphingomonas montana]|uniref:hypothetical protein n=1 Tax=Sphingomonas montana TaxID=1843236 RepID=UPI00096FABB7|nr:hypothetical protein [Sphingomonas montana]
MIGLALLLTAQAVAPSAEMLAARPPVVTTLPGAAAGQPQRVAVDPAAAVALFKTLCLPNLTDPTAFSAAVAASDLSFAAIPRRDAGVGQAWRADRALVTYGQARDGAMRCTVLGRATGSVDQLGFSARVAEALALKTGRTRSGKGQAVTDWSAAGPDGRAVRISAGTRNAADGGTDMRLSAALAK